MSEPVAGQFNTTPPTFGSGQFINLQTDNAGRLLVVGGGSSSTPIVVSGVAYTATASVTRPNDTTAYLANDVIGPTGGGTAAMTFASIGPAAGGEVMLTTVFLEIDISAVPSGMTSFTLYLYSVTPPSALADNAPFDLPAGDRASFLGILSLGTPVDLGSTLYVETDAYNKQITVASTASLFGYLVTTGAYTPNAQSVYKVGLKSVLL